MHIYMYKYMFKYISIKYMKSIYIKNISFFKCMYIYMCVSFRYM